MALKSITAFPTAVEETTAFYTTTSLPYQSYADWTDLTNIFDDDADYALCGPATIPYRNWLSPVIKLTGFNIDIPKSAKIYGIAVNLKVQNNGEINFQAQLLKNNLADGELKTSPTYIENLVTSTKTIGGSNDTWDSTINASDIRQSTFGVAIADKLTLTYFTFLPNSQHFFVSMTVYYDDGLEVETEQGDIVDQSEKQFYAKIYNPSGEYITSLYQEDFDWKPEFSLNINDGLSGIKPKLVHNINDLKYPSTGILDLGNQTINTYKGLDRLYNGIKLGNLISFFITDKETIHKKIYTGYIAGFGTSVNGNEENLYLDILPNITRFASSLVKSGNDTTVTFSSQDPADILKSIINLIPNQTYYTDTTLYDTGVSRTYQFVGNTALDAMKKTIELCPYGWFFYVGGDDYVYLKNFSDMTQTTKHTIPAINTMSIEASRSIYNMRNRVYFLGGGSPQMYRVYEKSGSINAFGAFEERITDERVTTIGTADSIAERFLKQHSKPSAELIVEIIDSNYSNKGYDIESINIGDTIVLHSDDFNNSETKWGNFDWARAYWLYDLYEYYGVPAYVQSIQYKYDRVVLNCVFDFPAQDNRMEDINRDLTNFRFKDAPTTPTEA